MDGSAGPAIPAPDCRPVLGTDQVRSVAYANGSYMLGGHAVDLRTGRASDAVPHELDATWLGLGEFGFEWVAWLDDNRVIGRRDHDVAVYDVRDRTRRIVMAFPDDVVSGLLIAPAVGVPATIR
jgi:hypothetical protein